MEMGKVTTSGARLQSAFKTVIAEWAPQQRPYLTIGVFLFEGIRLKVKISSVGSVGLNIL
jgi:hypothetical protein